MFSSVNNSSNESGYFSALILQVYKYDGEGNESVNT